MLGLGPTFRDVSFSATLALWYNNRRTPAHWYDGGHSRYSSIIIGLYDPSFVVSLVLFFPPIFRSFLSFLFFLKREYVSLCEVERSSFFKHFLRCARVLSLSRARLALNLFMDSTLLLLLFELVFLQGACDPDVSCTNTIHTASAYIYTGRKMETRYSVASSYSLLVLSFRKKKKIK